MIVMSYGLAFGRAAKDQIAYWFDGTTNSYHFFKQLALLLMSSRGINNDNVESLYSVS